MDPFLIALCYTQIVKRCQNVKNEMTLASNLNDIYIQQKGSI